MSSPQSELMVRTLRDSKVKMCNLLVSSVSSNSNSKNARSWLEGTLELESSTGISGSVVAGAMAAVVPVMAPKAEAF